MGKKEISSKVSKSAKGQSKASALPVKASKPPKIAPPPTPSSSSDESSDEPAPKSAAGKAPVVAKAVSSSSDEDSSSEEEVTRAAVKVKSSGPQESDDSTSDSSSSDSESPASGGRPQAAANGLSVKASKTAAESDSDTDSDSDSEDAPVAKSKVALPSSDDDDDSDDQTDTGKDKSSQVSSSDSSDSSDEEGDVVMKDGTSTTANKRKADADAVPPPKKAKLETSESSNPASATIWIGNLSWNVDDDWLKTEYEGYGELVSARVQMDRNSGRSRGFAYVEFKDVSAAQTAVDDKAKEIDGRAPRVDFAPPRAPPRGAPDQTKRAFNDKISEPTSVLFVGNLSFDATEDACWETFGDFGEVLSVRLPTDRDTQQRKGFGYVEFSEQASAVKALESLQGTELFGRSIRLDYSHPRAPGGGGGNRGFRGGDRGRGGFQDRGGRGRGGGRGSRGGRGGDRGFGDRGFRGSRGRGGGAPAFEGKKTTF